MAQRLASPASPCPTATATPIWARPPERQGGRQPQRRLRAQLPELRQRHPVPPPSPPRPPYYSCTVPFAVTKLDLNYKKSDSGASVSVSGNDELAVGANTVTIKVTAANGETRTYTIEVTREQDPNYKPSTNGKLSALTIEGASLSPVFRRGDGLHRLRPLRDHLHHPGRPGGG